MFYSRNLDPQKGSLVGEAFVTTRWEPKDEATKTYVESFAEELGLHKNTRPTTIPKLIRCLSDVLFAGMISATGQICWPMCTNSFTDGPYSRGIAIRVRKALTKAGHLQRVQAHRRGLSAVYLINKSIIPEGLNFVEHQELPVIEVRDEKPTVYWSKHPVKGRRMSLSQFPPNEITKLSKEVKDINALMKEHPLVRPDGSKWVSCRRVFNNGKLDEGGRFYGGWQQSKAADRLQFTIDDEPVCEIDIKASFLFLCAATNKWKHPLPADPYEAIQFVSNKPSLRPLAKKLVSSMLSNPNELTRFPRGDQKDQYGCIISLKDQYSLPRDAKVSKYTSKILVAFPFLGTMQGQSGKLMYLESQMILKAILSLANLTKPIVVYPIHDCLLCKRSDETEVTKAIQHVMLDKFGRVPSLDVEYSDQPTKLIASEHMEDSISELTPTQEDEDDFSVIDDLDE